MAQIAGGMATGNIMGSGYLTKSAAYTVVKADRGKTIDCTAALTLSLDAAATLGAGWMFFVKANGGAVTIDPNGGETIDGDATKVFGNGATAMVICDGTNFHTSMVGGLSVNTQIFTSSGTYTPTPGMVFCIIECIGGGGGGGGAHVGGVGRSHGANGGGGGTYSRLLATAATIGASQSVSIGAAGAAGISGSGSGTPGDGGNGGTTSVGSLCTAPGGNGGGRGWLTTLIQPAANSANGTGDISIPGDAGGAGHYQTTSSGTIILPSGKGGDGSFGGGAPAVIANSGFAHGNTPITGSYGAGGSGGGANNGVAYATGGAGHAGAVFITEFIQ